MKGVIDMLLFFDKLEWSAYILAFIAAALIIAAVVLLIRTALRVTNSYGDSEAVKKYKLYGIACTGKNAKIWYRDGTGIGISLEYEINGRIIDGKLDSFFCMDESEAKRLAETGESVEIFVDPHDETRFCLSRDLYSQKKEFHPGLPLLEMLGDGWALWSNYKFVIGIAIVLLLFFILH